MVRLGRDGNDGPEVDRAARDRGHGRSRGRPGGRRPAKRGGRQGHRPRHVRHRQFPARLRRVPRGPRPTSPGTTSSSSTWTSTSASGRIIRPASSAGSASGSPNRLAPEPPTTSTASPRPTSSAGATPICWRSYPLDLCCLGIGENGHLAFNDPPVADFDDPLDVKVVKLDAACRRQQVQRGTLRHGCRRPGPGDHRHHPGPAPGPPGRWPSCPKPARPSRCGRPWRVRSSTACPASVLQRAPHATIFLDHQSAGLLTSARLTPRAQRRRSARGPSQRSRKG